MTTAIAKAGQHQRVLPAVLSEVARQPRLVAASVGTIAAGLVTRRADLLRGGARMLAVHVIASAARTAIRHRTGGSATANETAGATAAVTEAVVAGLIGWVAEAAVDVALKRIVPDPQPDTKSTNSTHSGSFTIR